MKTNLLKSDQILRIESLGDNCELGFVLRNLGCEAGSLFRWTAISPERLLSTLRADFEGMYEFANLQPLQDDMVRDGKYGVGWHSEMRSTLEAGERLFLSDESKRRRIYGVEKHKIRYLKAKFVARAQLGGLLFVIKSKDGINPGTIDSIFEAISELAAGARFALLEVQTSHDRSLLGTVVQERAGVLRGYVSRFLVRNDPNPPDMDSWTPVLESALGLLSCPDWPKRLSEFRLAQTRVDLAFPLGRSQDLTKPIVGDLRAGAAILLHGNTWCRQVGDSFRLHGADPTHPATLLRWLAVHTLGACELHGTMQCPVEDSVPVSVVVTIRDDSEKVVGEWRSVIAPGDPDTLSINFSPAINRPVSIEMAAQASRPIESGERAVIDISPLALDPIDPSNARSETKAGDVARTGRVRALAQGAS